MAAPVDCHAEQSQNAHSLPVNVAQGNSYSSQCGSESNRDYDYLGPHVVGAEASDLDTIIHSLSGDMSLSDTRLAELVDRLIDWRMNGVSE